MCVCVLSHVWLFEISWIVACHASLSMGFSRQEYWSGLAFPSPGIFLTQGSNPGLLHHRQVKGHQPLHEGPTLVISSDASHFPKAPPPNAVTVQAGLQHVNHGVQAMQSIAPPFLTTNIISTSDTLQASHHSSNSIFFLWLPWWLRQ